MRISELNKKFCKNTKIYFGNESNKKLRKIIKNKKILIVTSKKGSKRILKNYSFLKYNKINFLDCVNSYPSIELVDDILKTFYNKNYDLIIAYGGGSVLDLAKILKIYFEINRKIFIKDLIKNTNIYKFKKKIDLVAIPTTAGTGSEVTNFGTVWDTKNKKKLSLESKRMFPTYAILDPKNTISLNYINTLYTAIDALNQLFDSFWNRNSSRKLRKICSIYIEKSIYQLKKVNRKNIDFNTRINLLYISLISGVCIKKTRTSICHSISYPLTNYYNVPHGLAVFFTTEEVVKLIYKKNKNYLNPLIKHTKFKDINEIIFELNALSKKHNIVKKVKSYIKKFSNIEKVLHQMFSKSRSKNFILNINKKDLRTILANSYE